MSDTKTNTYVDTAILDKIERNKEFIELESIWQMTRHSELERLFSTICKAYSLGMSVVEIKRATGAKSVQSILKTLSTKGMIVDLPKKSTVRYKLPENLRYGFERIGFEFSQWCHIYSFDPKHATAALQKDPDDPMPEAWRKVHLMASIDLPVAYSDQYQTSPPEYVPGYTREKERPSMFILWDNKSMWYCGSIPENPIIKCYGKTPDDVFFKLKDFCNIERQANRLEAAIIRFTHQQD